MSDRDVSFEAEASGNAQIYQAGRDQFVVGRDLHLVYESDAHRVYKTTPGPAECPYPGLVEFRPEQGNWYFGREELVDELLRRLDERRTRGGPLVLVAPSGAGKSSLLRAGLLAALSENRLEGAPGSVGSLFTPTDRPLAELARKLATVVGVEPDRLIGPLTTDVDAVVALLREALRARADEPGWPARVVLVVDQLEELFTSCVDESERRAFVTALARLAAPSPDGQPPTALVVYGLRADFYAACTRYPVLRSALEDGQILLGPMSPVELRAAIRYPARLVGLDVEEGLVELLLADLGGADYAGQAGQASRAGSVGWAGQADYEAGRLPLLAHALRATWQQRHGSVLTVAGYQLSGGIREAVARTAEDVYGGLDEAGRRAARVLFGHLVNLGGEGVDNTRRRVERASLPGAADGGVMTAVIDAFTRGRLLTQDQRTVGITHEALLRSWPRLQEWIDADRAANLTRQELDQAAADWERTGGESSRLYRGSRLETARRWAAAHGGTPAPVVAAFLAASARAHRRGSWVRRGIAVVLAGLSVATAVTAVVALNGAEVARTARDSARAARDTAVFNQVTAEADQVRDTDASLAALLDLTAYRMRATPELRTKLLASENTPLATSLNASSGLVRSVAVSGDGRTLATGDQAGAVRLWDITDPTRPTPRGRPLRADHGPAAALAFHGRVLASTGMGAVQLWSLDDLARPRKFGRLTGHVGAVSTVAFGPDGRTAASAGEDGTIRLWDVTDPARPRARGRSLTGPGGPAVFAAAFSPNGRTLATVDNSGSLRLWNVANPDRAAAAGPPPPSGHTGPVLSVAFSPDGQTLATGSQDRTVRLWNVANPARPTPMGNLTGHTSYVWSVAFSPDGRTLASASYDHSVLLWNVIDPNHPAVLGRALTGHTGPVTSVAFGPDGRTLFTGSHDHTVRLWSLPATVLTGHTGGVEAVAFSPDGRVLASAGDDRTVRLWDVRDAVHPRALGSPLTGFTDLVNTVAFSPDGRTLAAGGKDRTIRLWNVADPARPTSLARLTGPTGYVWSVAFSPDGHTLASGDDKGVLRLWNTTDPARTTLMSTVTRHTGPVTSVAFSPDGRRLATGSGDRTVLLWDLLDLPPTPVGGPPADAHTGPIWSVAWSRDGHTLASASEDGTLRLWDVADPAHARTLGPAVNAHTNTVYSVAFSPDGRTLASSGQDSTVRLWNVADQAHPVSLGPPLSRTADTAFAVAFSPDGRTLASVSADRTVQLWSTDLAQAVQRLCTTAHHVLTRQQWKNYASPLPYTPPCS